MDFDFYASHVPYRKCDFDLNDMNTLTSMSFPSLIQSRIPRANNTDTGSTSFNYNRWILIFMTILVPYRKCDFTSFNTLTSMSHPSFNRGYLMQQHDTGRHHAFNYRRWILIFMLDHVPYRKCDFNLNDINTLTSMSFPSLIQSRIPRAQIRHWSTSCF